jgi:uncharacterized protein (TIGR00251 family)
MLVTVRVHPKASRAAIAWDGETLQVWVDAPAVEGKANRRAVEIVARGLGVRRSAVQIVRGDRARHKVFEIDGLDPARLREIAGEATSSGAG